MELAKVIGGLRRGSAEFEDVEAMLSLDGGGAKGTLTSTLAAFANADGGIVIIGLDERDKFAAAGVEDAAATEKALVSLGRDKLTPPPVMNVRTVSFKGVTLVIAEVEALPASARPCYVKAKGLYGGAYLRIGDGDHRLTSYEIDRMKENQAQPRWDREPVPEASKQDLDPDAFGVLLEYARQRAPRVFGYADETDALAMLGVLVRHDDTLVPSLAGLLSVGRHPQQFFPQLIVTVAVHPHDERGRSGARGGSGSRGGRLRESVTLTGAIPGMVAGAVEAVQRNLGVVSRLAGPGWEDRPEIDADVIREAVVNALVHRDYSPQARGTQVQVDVFPGRLEVASPGGLFGNVSLEGLGSRGTSSSRNPRLAALLQEIGDPVTGYPVAENRGSGTSMMNDRVRLATGIVPLYAADIDEFRVVVPRRSPVTTGFRAALLQQAASAGPSGARLSDTQVTALALAHSGYDIDHAVLRRLGLPASQARGELADLVDRGLLRSRSARPGSEGPYRIGVDLSVPEEPVIEAGQSVAPALLSGARDGAGARVANGAGTGVADGMAAAREEAAAQALRELIMNALRETGEVSRRELQKTTGSSRGLVAGALSDLIDAGLVEATTVPRIPYRRYRAVRATEQSPSGRSSSGRSPSGGSKASSRS